MKKTPIYTYLGTNGTITSPVHLEGSYSIVKYRLEAAAGMILVKDNGAITAEVVTVPAEEVDL